MRCKQQFGREDTKDKIQSPFIMDQDDDKLYFPISEIKFQDLHDWAVQSEQHGLSIGSPAVPNSFKRRLNRQKSKTGSLANINDTRVALFRYESQVYAINEKCPHAGGPLHIGDIEELPDKSLCVRCPWHSWRFSLHTGKVVRPTGQDKQAVIYPVRVRPDGTILIGFTCFSQKYFHDIPD